jgi:CRP-like cAMP-binding protein
MSHDERVDCLCYGDWAKHACSSRLLKKGDPPGGLRVLLSGEAMVIVCGDEVAILEPGDVFGEISFALAQPATADVVAKTDVF